MKYLDFYNAFGKYGVVDVRNVGEFNYRSIKPELFFGINAGVKGVGSFWISDPEKTLLDSIYFHSGRFTMDEAETMRLNYDAIRSTIDPGKLTEYLTLFASSGLKRLICKH